MVDKPDKKKEKELPDAPFSEKQQQLLALGYSEEAVKEVTAELESRYAEKKGLWHNIHQKRKRIKAGSGERMRKPGSKGAPSAADIREAGKDDD